jgi:TonB family protein
VAEITESTSFVGQVLDGRYKIVREIAAGGMSVVYEAIHIKIGRVVAIKVLHRDMAGDPEVVGRFLNEAKAVGTFGHPNIVASTDFGELPGHVPYLVLEYLEGHTLSHEISVGGPLPIRRVARIAVQIASALGAAHARNVIHRDLTSANIFLVKKEDGVDQVKVLDFGISKFLSAGDGSPKTRRGLTMGTPEFMSPEQISDPDSVDERVDIYALGVIMYHMLAGQLPFTRAPLQSLLTQIVVEPPPPIDRQSIPEPLLAMVFKALDKTPAERFPSMREMGRELETLSARIFSGGDRNEVGAYDSGPRAWPVPTTPSGVVVPAGAPTSGPLPSPAPQTHLSGPLLAASIVTDPALPQNGGRRLLYVSLALALVSVGGAAFIAMRSLRAPAPPPAPTQAVVAPLPPVPPAPVEPAFVHIQLSSPTPQARATLRGRTRMLPLALDIKPGAEPEAVELTAPGREGKRYWITLDRSVTLGSDLPPGRGVADATAEETTIALGGKPVGNEPARVPPSTEDAPAASAHHGHRRSSGGLTLAKATSSGDRAPSESPPELKPASSTTLAKVDPTPPSSVPVKAAAPSTKVASAPASPSSSHPAPAASVATAARPLARGMDLAKTQAAVRSHLSEVQRCYERGKMDDPDIKGRVTLRISVSEAGAVSSVLVESSSLGSSAVESCIASAIKGWKFPAPVGGPAVISYPFNLH